jgi:hypothetical protein
MEVRTENAALKRKEVEISKAQATNRVEKINSEYDAITKENSEPEKPHSPEQKQKKRREARRVIVTEVSSASDDDLGRGRDGNSGGGETYEYERGCDIHAVGWAGGARGMGVLGKRRARRGQAGRRAGGAAGWAA